MKKTYILLLLELEEEVTPSILAAKVDHACHEQYALREGESVVASVGLAVEEARLIIDASRRKQS